MTEELYDKIYNIVYPFSPPNTDGFHKEQFEKVALLIDPYFLLKEAQSESKKIQVKPPNSPDWLNPIHTLSFTYPVECYRIKPPVPKVGEYYQHLKDKDIYIFTTNEILVNTETGYVYLNTGGNTFDSFEKVIVEIKLKN